MGVIKCIGQPGQDQPKASLRSVRPYLSRQLRTTRSLLMLFAAVISYASSAAEDRDSLPPEFQWPAPTRENRPWTRWWWLGSAVDKTNLTRLLPEYRDAGI